MWKELPRKKLLLDKTYEDKRNKTDECSRNSFLELVFEMLFLK